MKMVCWLMSLVFKAKYAILGCPVIIYIDEVNYELSLLCVELHILSSTTAKVGIDAPVPEVAVLPTEGTCDGQCCATCPLSEQEKRHVESERYFYADMETLLYEFTPVSSVEDKDVNVESTIKNGASAWSIRDAYEHDRGELNVTKEKQVGGMRSNVTTLLQAHITGLRHFQDYLIEVRLCGLKSEKNICIIIKYYILYIYIYIYIYINIGALLLFLFINVTGIQSPSLSVVDQNVECVWV
jgi:hypothetical protein